MTYRTVNPATGETIRTFTDISDADLDEALETARSCYQDDWRHRPVADRARIVKAAAAELRASASEYARCVTVEMGKLIGTSQAEVALSAAILDYYADRAETFLAPRELPESPGAVIETEPIGVILAIEPWNFPYYQLARVAGPQLMAGNVLVIKHAENVPQCALAFARLFERAGAPPGAYTNVFASIDQIGRVIEDPRIAGVTVTGSERAGSAVAERAGRHLKKTVMELGGSDPLIVLQDADLDDAVAGALFGRMFNTDKAASPPSASSWSARSVVRLSCADSARGWAPCEREIRQTPEPPWVRCRPSGHWTCSWTRSASPPTAARKSPSAATGSTVRATTLNRPS